jgi:opacity protein-like surface antigen
MRKLLIAAVAVSALTAAAPSFAQSVGDRAANITVRIDRGVRNGDLTYSQAQDLRARLRNVERLEARYRYNGLTGWEVRDLQRRYDALSSDVRFQRHDNQYRYQRDYDDWRY